MIYNRKARFEYFIEDELEVGIVLAGWEVKALAEGRADMTGSHAYVRDSAAYLVNLKVTPTAQAFKVDVSDHSRTRKLLLHKHQLRKLRAQVERDGYTLVPLNLHFSHGKVKVQLAVAKGKKLYDKRETVKKRDQEREARTALKEKV